MSTFLMGLSFNLSATLFITASSMTLLYILQSKSSSEFQSGSEELFCSASFLGYFNDYRNFLVLKMR